MFQHSPEPLSLPHHDQLFMSKLPSSRPLFVQHPALEIIQLTEVAPPPRASQTPFSLTASSLASSSYTSSSDESEEESACSSYCSSDPEEDARASVPDDTYKTRLHRVLVWREMLAKAMGAAVISSATSPFPPPLKRKAHVDEVESDDDVSSHSSKRSRSSAYRSQAPPSQKRLSAHSCPACDASFSTRRSLQRHGRSSSPNDACRTAVEYDFEA